MSRLRIAPKRETLGTHQEERVQTNTLDMVRQFNRNPQNFGVAVGPHTFAGGDTNVFAHSLGRIPNGFMAIDAQTSEWAGWRTEWTEQTITLYSNNAGTYLFWVF